MYSFYDLALESQGINSTGVVTSFCPNSRETISSWKESQRHIVRECMEDIVVLLSFKKILPATEVKVEYRT